MKHTTQHIYSFWLKRYTQFLCSHRTEIEHLPSTQKISSFLTEEVGCVSASYRNQAVSALAHYYKHERGTNIDVSSLRAKTSHHEPVHFTREEFFKILPYFNSQYRLLALLLTGSIPKLSIVLRLRLEHLNLSRKEININNEIFPIPTSAISLLASQHGWIFPGRQQDTPLCTQSVQHYFRRMKTYDPRIKPQTFCNTFWVWLWRMDGVTDYEIFRWGQKIGLKTWASLERYHIAAPQVKSPLDNHFMG